MAPRQIDRLLDLAKFLARRGKVQQSEQVLATAAEVAPESPRLLFAHAEMYIQRQRNLQGGTGAAAALSADATDAGGSAAARRGTAPGTVWQLNQTTQDSYTESAVTNPPFDKGGRGDFASDLTRECPTVVWFD